AISGFLSVEGYGMYKGVYDFLAFFGIIADLGLFTIAVREMGRGERERDFIASNIFGMRMILAVLAMSLATIAAFAIPAYSGTPIPTGVAIASMAVFLAIMHGTVSSVLQVELKMQYATIGLVGGKLLSLGWMMAVIFYFFAGDPSDTAFYYLLLAGTVGNLFAFAFTFYYALKYAKLRPKFNADYWKEIMVTSVPYGLALILNMVYFRIDSIMILWMDGPRENGFYGPAVSMLEILSVVPVYFMNSVLPTLSKAVKDGGKKVTRILQLSFDFLYILGLPMAVGLFILAYPIIFLITQPEFLSQLDKGIYGSDIALQILVFAMFFAFLNSVFTYTMVAVNKQNHLLWINGIAAVGNIVANFFVIPEYGFRGAAMTSVATEFFILFVAFFVVRRFVKMKFSWGRLGKATFAAALMGVTVWYLREPSFHWLGMENFNVIFLTAVGALVYGSTLLLTKTIPQEFLNKAKKRLG
ncbi:MAG: O-antigen/teichoic acid export membrane protein, partial [Oceanicoccus sp.]